MPRERQVRAVKFLAEHLLATPQWMLDPAVTQRLRASEQQLWLGVYQRALVRQLLSPARTQRLLAQEAQLGPRAYRFDELLGDLRRGVFSELPAGAAISPPRRNLQRVYVDALTARLGGINLLGLDDGEAVVRAELRELKAVVNAAATQGDRGRRAHLLGLADTIDKALDPKFAAPANPLAALMRAMGLRDDAPGEGQGLGHDDEQCWPSPFWLPAGAVQPEVR